MSLNEFVTDIISVVVTVHSVITNRRIKSRDGWCPKAENLVIREKREKRHEEIYKEEPEAKIT